MKGYLKDYGQAILDINEALRISPQLIRARIDKAFLLSITEDPELRAPEVALGLAKEVLARDPTDAHAMNAKACALAAQKNFASAVEWQKKASENNEWLKDELIGGGYHAAARIAAWESGQLWRP